MIYIKGDTHRDFDRVERFCTRIQTTRDDILIILGDAGINYFGGWRDEDFKRYLAMLPITIFCIHGNHEARPSGIPSYRIAEWHGGKVYVEDEYPNLLFAMDGEVYELGGLKTIVIGGAYSVDKEYRLLRGYHWFPDEQPSPEIRRQVEAQLDALDWNVDVVLSHTVPLLYM